MELIVNVDFASITQLQEAFPFIHTNLYPTEFFYRAAIITKTLPPGTPLPEGFVELYTKPDDLIVAEFGRVFGRRRKITPGIKRLTIIFSMYRQETLDYFLVLANRSRVDAQNEFSKLALSIGRRRDIYVEMSGLLADLSLTDQQFLTWLVGMRYDEDVEWTVVRLLNEAFRSSNSPLISQIESIVSRWDKKHAIVAVFTQEADYSNHFLVNWLLGMIKAFGVSNVNSFLEILARSAPYPLSLSLVIDEMIRSGLFMTKDILIRVVTNDTDYLSPEEKAAAYNVIITK
jgi:hypothetical protein